MKSNDVMDEKTKEIRNENETSSSSSSAEEDILEEVESIPSDESANDDTTKNGSEKFEMIEMKEVEEMPQKNIAVTSALAPTTLSNLQQSTSATKTIESNLTKSSFDRSKFSASKFSSFESRKSLSSPLLPIKELKTNANLSSKFSQSSTESGGKYVKFDKMESTQKSDEKPSSTLSSGSTLEKADLPGRVSFSKNDVFEIDYSDFDNETDLSRSPEHSESSRKKNVHFEDEFFNQTESHADNKIDENISFEDRELIEDDVKNVEKNDENAEQKYCCSLKCNTINCTANEANEKPEKDIGEHRKSSVDESERIIEEYKREIENINRRHELELKWSGNKSVADYIEANDATQENGFHSGDNSVPTSSTGSPSEFMSSPEAVGSPVAKSKLTLSTNVSNTSEESPTRDSTSTVINNYLRTRSANSSAATSKSSSSTASSKTKSATSNASIKKATPMPSKPRKIKSAQIGNGTTKAKASTDATSKMTKARSMATIQNGSKSKLNEFHIDKVESWMSTHVDDTLSDTALSSSRRGKFGSMSNLEYKRTWRETPTSKTDDEGNFSLDDPANDAHSIDDSATFSEIELVLKKMEGHSMKISVGAVQSASPRVSTAGSTSQPTPRANSSAKASGNREHASTKVK